MGDGKSYLFEDSTSIFGSANAVLKSDASSITLDDSFDGT